MFLGVGIRDRNVNFSTCWPELEFGFKALMITCLITTLFFLVFPDIGYYFPNEVTLIIQKYQLWRLFFSFLYHGNKIKAFLNVLFNVYILYICMPDIEKRYSTIYVVIETFLKVFINNLLLVVIGYPLVIFGILQVQDFLGFGLLPVIFTFLWHKVSQTPQEPVNFCWLPCRIPMKFVPLCYYLLQIIFNNPIGSMIIYCLYGYFEHMILKKSFVQLPLALYKRIDSIVPESIANRSGYIKVVKVQQDLKNLCGHGCCNNEDETQINERVEIIGGGVSIGGQSSNQKPNLQNDIRSHWLKKDQELQVQRIKKEIELREKEQKQTESRKIEFNQIDIASRQEDQPQFSQFQSQVIPANDSIQYDKKSQKSNVPLLLVQPAAKKEEYDDEDFT